MDVTLLILRVTHILSGVFWAGGGLVSIAFINPTAKTLTQDAAAFMKHFNYVRRFPLWMSVFGVLNVVTGSWMYYRLFGDRVAFDNGYATALSLGAIFGVAAIFMGLGMMLPMGNKLEALMKEIAAGGKPPTAEQGAKMSVMQEKLMRWAVMVTTLLIFAVVAMAANEVL